MDFIADWECEMMLYTFDVVFASLYNCLKSPLYWIVVFIIWLQYKKVGKLEKDVIGRNNQSSIQRTFSSALTGIVGGIIGSIMITISEISISPYNFSYLFILALLLMLIHPRFICFSYSGGILSLLNLTIGWPHIDIPSVMAIVAILHLVESLLILIDGHKSRVPLLIEKNNQIIGCFNMFRFWPIPLAMIVNTAHTSSNFINYNTHLYMAGIVAMLGYGDIAITKYPQEKARETAINLFLFSIILLIISILSREIILFRFLAAIFSPVAHEFLIQLGKGREKKGLPIFTSHISGIRVLDVINNGVADKIGLRSGNIITAINGRLVNKKTDVENILFYRPQYIWIDYYDNKGCIKTGEYRDYKKRITSLDMLVIPRQSSYSYCIKEKNSILHRILIKVKEKVS